MTAMKICIKNNFVTIDHYFSADDVVTINRCVDAILFLTNNI